MEFKQVIFIVLWVTSMSSFAKTMEIESIHEPCMTPDNSFGMCIPIDRCDVIMKYLQEGPPLTAHENVGLKSYVCGSSLSQRRICCPSGEFSLGWVYSDCKTPDEDMGKCKPASSCGPIVDFIKNSPPIDKMVKAELQKYICKSKTVKSTDATVCCPFKPIIISNSYTDVRPKLVDHSQHQNVNLLSNNCGQGANDDKINNGNATKIFEYPWAVALKIKTGDMQNYDCGGSLINRRYVLTTAHCIRSGNREVVGVRLGEHNFETEVDCNIGPDNLEYCAPPHQDFDVSVSDAIVHPQYDSKSLENDIALIRLRNAVEISNAIAPVCLPITIAEKMNKQSSYTVIGWGITGLGRKSESLMKADVPSQDIRKCVGVSSFIGQLCAGGINQSDACRGDSGGALMGEYVDDYLLKYIQYGIVSRGSRICGKENLPTIYTNVAIYMGWILDNLKL